VINNFPVIYIVIYSVLLFLHLFSSFLKNENKSIDFIFLFTWIFLAIFSGTRVCVGGDWLGYRDLFRSQNTIKFELFSTDPTETLFRLIAYFVNYLGFSFEFFNLIISILTCAFLFFGIRKISKNYSFLLTLLYFSIMYFNHQFGLIRTGLAVSIFIYSLSFLDFSKKKYFGLGIISYNMHNSSLFPTLLTFLLNRNINKNIVFSFTLLMLLFIFRSDLLLKVLLFILDLFNSKYLNYSDAAEIYLKKSATTNTTFITIALFLFYLFSKVKVNPLYVNLTAFFILINLAFPYQAILSRLNAFLLIPVWIFIVQSMEKYKFYTRVAINIILIIYSFTALSLIFFNKDLVLFRYYQTWLFDFSLTFDQCSTEYQF
jgi:hypothetical protein